MIVNGAEIGVLNEVCLAWRPFLDPINAHPYWWALLIPLSLGVSVVYKAVRLTTLDRYWREVIVMTVQVVASMILLGAASYFFVDWLVPLLAPK